jgi:hypothetical protein
MAKPQRGSPLPPLSVVSNTVGPVSSPGAGDFLGTPTSPSALVLETTINPSARWGHRALGFGHFTKTFVSQHFVFICSFEPIICNCVPCNKIAEQALGDPRGNCRNGQTPVHPGRGAGRFRVQAFSAPLPGCDSYNGLFRGLARKQPWPTPGYYPPTPSGVGRPVVFGCSSASNWLLGILTWLFSPCLRERMAVWQFLRASARRLLAISSFPSEPDSRHQNQP